MTWRVIPKFLARVNLAWVHGLSAAISMCLFVSRAPTSRMATSALEELDNLTSLFDVSASTCRPAAKSLPSVQNLRRKAHEAMGPPHTRFYHHHEASDISATPISSVPISELDRLNGRTYFLSDHPSSSSSTSASASASAADPRHAPHHDDNLHPTLAQDLRDFAAHSPLSIFLRPSQCANPQRIRTPLPVPPPSSHDSIPIAGPSRQHEEPPSQLDFSLNNHSNHSFTSRPESNLYLSPRAILIPTLSNPTSGPVYGSTQVGIWTGFSARLSEWV
ncbi:hypothetical protein CPB84DRAFT_1850111 [Gymnopilus junonius]|uniref:Uncharacterized protein n=1 Tax=Gymnopilus junonius TaxID=109634 RepID=A0A9P5NHD8_GYMJU|nr:hypothetical protein CPB84DRAFT_1850111 [Gymnopilus junonius]